MDNIEFKDKFIGFVDILGFKKMVQATAAGTGMPLPELLETLTKFGAPDVRKHFEEYRPTICPGSISIQRDLDFLVTQISDCLIVSSEVSPAGVINLVNHCWGAVIKLLTKGIMCRGYITRGLVYHTDAPQIIGPGYQNAYSHEKEVAAFKREADERGTPFVEVDQAVCNYVMDYGDSCVKEMFSRYVKNDGVVIALFPFKRLAHSFVIGGFLGNKFDPEKEKHSNKNMRLWIENFKERVMSLVDQSNPNAVSKAEHYIAALDAQLEVCERTDEMIDMLNSPYPSGRIK
jgi:hypothetical protein